MGLLAPDPVLEAVLTRYENGQIVFQFMSFKGPHTADDVRRLLATVLHNLNQSHPAAPPAPAPDLFAEELV